MMMCMMFRSIVCIRSIHRSTFFLSYHPHTHTSLSLEQVGHSILYSRWVVVVLVVSLDEHADFKSPTYPTNARTSIVTSFNLFDTPEEDDTLLHIASTSIVTSSPYILNPKKILRSRRRAYSFFDGRLQSIRTTARLCIEAHTSDALFLRRPTSIYPFGHPLLV